MTTRSFESLASERRLKNRVTDDDLFKQVFLAPVLLYFAYYYHATVTLSVSRASSSSPGGCHQLTRLPHSYLTYLLTPKPSESPTTSAVISRDPRDRESRDVSTKLTAYTSSLYDSFTDLLGDFAGRDGSKAVRFPERLIKVLEGKLQDIFMAKDPKYGTSLTLSCLANMNTLQVHRFTNPTYHGPLPGRLDSKGFLPPATNPPQS